jgi:hypothetical protein
LFWKFGRVQSEKPLIVGIAFFAADLLQGVANNKEDHTKDISKLSEEVASVVAVAAAFNNCL